MSLLHQKKLDIYANISLFLSYSEVTVATWSGPYPAQMITAVNGSSPYPDQHLEHWSQTQFLEGHSSAQICSNPNQTHLIQLIKVFGITRYFQARVSWSWLELNSAELWPSRNWVWDNWPRDNLYSPERQRSLGHVDEPQIQIYSDPVT